MTQDAGYHEVTRRRALETDASDANPLTPEGLAGLDPLILRECKTDKNEARTGASVKI